jgi:hypothetical protein
MNSSTWVVIVNYRSAQLAKECLAKLVPQAQDARVSRIVVVDNASGDGSVGQLEDAVRANGWGGICEILPQPRNGGFAYGNNAVLRQCLESPSAPAYVMLLNPDTAPCPGAIATLVAFMDANAKAGIAGTRLLDEHGATVRSAHAFPTPLGELESGASLGLLSRMMKSKVVSPPPRDVSHACDWVSGASMIIRRKVLEDIGVMDEGYFLYFEEVDYCRRVKSAGWEIWQVPDAAVVHREGSVTGIVLPGARRPYYWFDSRRRYFLKWHGIHGLLAADLLWALGRASLRLRLIVGLGARRETTSPGGFARDLIWGDVKAVFLRERRLNRHA